MAALIFEVLAADLASRSLIERDKQDEVAEALQSCMRASQAKVVDTMSDQKYRAEVFIKAKCEEFSNDAYRWRDIATRHTGALKEDALKSANHSEQWLETCKYILKILE